MPPKLWITSTPASQTLYIMAMLILRRGLPVGALCLVPFLLMGCGAASLSSGTAQPAETAPVFASNEEALAAATTAYAKYIAKAAVILASGGSGSEQIAEFVTPDYLPALLNSFQKLAESGNRNDGLETIDRVSLIRYHDGAAQEASVSLYLCADITKTRVLDANGVDVTPENRPKRIPLQVSLVSGQTDPVILLVAKEDVWSGRDFC